MAGMKLRVASTAEVACLSATAKTVLQFTAASDTPAILRGLSLGFDGVTATDAPALVKLMRQSAAGSGGIAITPVLENTQITYTPQGTAAYNVTAGTETSTDLLAIWEIHPQGGGLVEDFSIYDQIVIPVSGILGLVVTAGANVNCAAFFKLEE